MFNKVEGISLENKVDKYEEETISKMFVRALIQVFITVMVFNVLGLNDLGKIIGVIVGLFIVIYLNKRKLENSDIYGIQRFMKVDDSYIDIEEHSRGWFDELNKHRVNMLGFSYYLAGVGMYEFLGKIKEVSSPEGLVFFTSILVFGVVTAYKVQKMFGDLFFKNINYLLVEYTSIKCLSKKIEENEVSVEEAERLKNSLLAWFIGNNVLELEDGSWESANEWSKEEEKEFQELVNHVASKYQGKLAFYSLLGIIMKEDLKGVEDVDRLKVNYLLSVSDKEELKKDRALKEYSIEELDKDYEKEGLENNKKGRDDKTG